MEGSLTTPSFMIFFAEKGTTFRFSCPHTSQQNGKSERMIRTINNAICCLMFQARLPPSYWVEALHTAVHILNLLPSKAIQNKFPFSVLFKKPISYTHLKTHKLSPRSSKCLFIGYPSDHRGYRCLDLTTNKIILSRHVAFDETQFPYQDSKAQKTSTYDFLSTDTDPSPLLRSILETPMAPSNPVTPPAPQDAPTPPAPPAVEAPRHSMSTRSKHGITKPKQIFSLLAKPFSALPKSHIQALNDPNWNPSMTIEYNAIVKSETFDLVPRPSNTNIVRSMWLYKHKYDADGN